MLRTQRNVPPVEGRYHLETKVAGGGAYFIIIFFFVAFFCSGSGSVAGVTPRVRFTVLSFRAAFILAKLIRCGNGTLWKL